MRRRLRLLMLGALLGSGGALLSDFPAWGHGARLSFQPTSSITLEATYDNGEPMKAAQILVYSPDNPAEPWVEGTTDDQGIYVFTPDPAIVGNWEVTVRQAGHGDVVTIPVGAEVAQAAPASDGGRRQSALSELSLVQQGVVVGSVIWGFVGTALFFSRGKR